MNGPGAGLLAAATLVAVGCTPIYEGHYAYDEGWRKATVTDVLSGDDPTLTATLDCRAKLGREASAGHVFARVTYSYARNVRSMIVAVAEGDAPRPGMAAYVDAADCTRPLRLSG